MNYRMVHFSEIESLRASLQFLAFSEAYLYSAAHLCAALAASPTESSYPRGAVVLSLSFHGIELFLKAAILEKVLDEQFCGKAGHDLEFLGKRYANLYPGKKFSFEIPFGTEEIELVNPDPRVIEELNLFMAEHKRATPADQLNRYPRDIEGKPWYGIYAFEPNTFAAVIAKAQQDMTRLKELIFHG
ncbi:MAG: hypothetical protein JRE47_07785 [Deltaproteobacteria bacterium]|nr:hypothetical protein [Deltaproteobacteria bacterium]